MVLIKQAFFTVGALAVAVFAHPAPAPAPNNRAFENGQDAIALNDKFQGLKDGDACNAGENACIDGKFAQCVGGTFSSQPCAPGTICAALPLVNSRGTSITCTTQADMDRRIAATGAKSKSNKGSGNTEPKAPAGTGATEPEQPSSTSTSEPEEPTGNGAEEPIGGNVGAQNPDREPSRGGDDPQTSLTLDPAVIAKGFEKDGQEVPTPGQVPSLTSRNNFINFCLKSKGLPISNGKQVKSGSCNPAPMGLIPSTRNMPSCKFVFPKNNEVIDENKSFTIKLKVKKLQTGNFVNAQSNYYSAPQQLDNQGRVIGHSHVVVERITGLGQTEPTDPNVFAFFKGVNDKADGNGILSAVVEKGLPAGTYRLASIIAAANHQPVLVAVAQRGTLDDAVYFQVKKRRGGKA